MNHTLWTHWRKMTLWTFREWTYCVVRWYRQDGTEFSFQCTDWLRGLRSKMCMTRPGHSVCKCVLSSFIEPLSSVLIEAAEGMTNLSLSLSSLPCSRSRSLSLHSGRVEITPKCTYWLRHTSVQVALGRTSGWIGAENCCWREKRERGSCGGSWRDWPLSR